LRQCPIDAPRLEWMAKDDERIAGACDHWR